jgi:hypothetical protein
MVETSIGPADDRNDLLSLRASVAKKAARTVAAPRMAVTRTIGLFIDAPGDERWSHGETWVAVTKS